jgi:hypothetical protein
MSISSTAACPTSPTKSWPVNRSNENRPGIAEAQGEDLAPAAAARERIGGRDGVGLTAVDVDAQDLAEQHVGVLRLVLRVTLGGRRRPC